MATLTVRLPNDKHERLKILAKSKGMSLNRLMDELATTALAENDAYTRFQLRATGGSAKEGLKILDKLDNSENKNKFSDENNCVGGD